MSVLIQADQLRLINLGQRAQKSTGTLAASTVPLFTIAGGRVLLTAIYGLVEVSITVANSYKLQSNPTASGATTSDMCTATDIGTTDTPAGDILGITAPGSAMARGGVVATLGNPLVLPVGQIESVSAGTDGSILWVVNWVPLDSGATLAAA